VAGLLVMPNTFDTLGGVMGQVLGTAAAIGSLALVGVTVWYAWQTQQMVREMRNSRIAAIRPSLRLDLGGFSTAASIEVENLGVGPAVDVSVDLIVLVGGDEIERQHWSVPLLRSGERRTMLMPNKDGNLGNFAPVQYWAERDSRILMTGSCLDLDGREHRIDDDFSFAVHSSRGPEGSWEGVEDRLPKNVEKIAKELESIRRRLERQQPGVEQRHRADGAS